MRCVDQAAKNRLHAWLGPIGSWLAPSLVRSLEPTVGVDPAELRPIDRIAEVRVPVLMAAGSADRYTPIAESKALSTRSGRPRSSGRSMAPRTSTCTYFALAEYQRRTGAFLHRTLVSNGVASSRVGGCV